MRIKILPWQLEILKSDKPFLAIKGGLASGKTRCIAQFLYQEMILYPNSRHCLCSATLPQIIESSFIEIIKYFDELKVPYTFNKNEHKFQLNYKNNKAIIKCQSLDVPVDQLRGPEWSTVVIDEAAQISEDKWRTISDRARNKNGSRKVRVFSNSKDLSPYHWIMKDFKPGHPTADLITVTTYHNPHLPPEYIPRLEARYPPGTPEHKRWMLGEVVAKEGAVYKNIESILMDSSKLPQFVNEARAIDWGHAQDPTVILMAGLDQRGRIFVYDEKRFHKSAFSEFKPIIERNCSGVVTFADHSSADMAEMKLLPIPLVYAHKDREYGIDLVACRIYDKSVFITNNCQELIKEMFEYSYLPYGGTGEAKTTHSVSHGPDALRYLVVGIDHQIITPEQAQRASSCFTF